MWEMTEFIWLRIGSRGKWRGMYGNEFARNFFTNWLVRNYQLLTEVSATCNLWVRGIFWSALFIHAVNCYDYIASLTDDWNGTNRGNTEVLGQKPVSVPLCAPRIPNRMASDWTAGYGLKCRGLTAWTVAQPDLGILIIFTKPINKIRCDNNSSTDTGIWFRGNVLKDKCSEVEWRA
jgi:hypothetical protein